MAKSIRFEEVKNKIREVITYSNLTNKYAGELLLLNTMLMSNGKSPVDSRLYRTKSSKELLNKINETINWWDVRDYKSLINAFPEANLPKWLYSSNVNVDMDENCKWILYTNY